jgi:membrane protein implicated in regulation of membrane protease activity
MARQHRDKGVSLAKGPVGIVGLVLLAYGVLALIFGGNGFTTDPVDGTVQGTKWLGFEGNGWSNVLTAAAGALLLFGSPTHWGAKSLSLIVGLALGAASVIAMADGDDVFGIFAANGLTELAWGIAALVLIVLALLPLVGGRDRVDHTTGRTERRLERDRDTAASGRPGSVTARDR